MMYEVGYYYDRKWWNDMIGELEHDGFDKERFFVSHWMKLPDKPK